jgi:hypothetical protein
MVKNYERKRDRMKRRKKYGKKRKLYLLTQSVKLRNPN